MKHSVEKKYFCYIYYNTLYARRLASCWHIFKIFSLEFQRFAGVFEKSLKKTVDSSGGVVL